MHGTKIKIVNFMVTLVIKGFNKNCGSIRGKGREF